MTPIILENVDFPDNLPVVKSRLREVHFFSYLWDTTDKDQSSYADDFAYNLLSEVLEFDVPMVERVHDQPFLSS